MEFTSKYHMHGCMIIRSKRNLAIMSTPSYGSDCAAVTYDLQSSYCFESNSGSAWGDVRIPSRKSITWAHILAHSSKWLAEQLLLWKWLAEQLLLWKVIPWVKDRTSGSLVRNLIGELTFRVITQNPTAGIENCCRNIENDTLLYHLMW